MTALLAIVLAFAEPATPDIPAPDLEIALPIDGLQVTALHDSFAARHAGRPHRAIDLLVPRGTPIHAVMSGTIQKLTRVGAGGITIYQYDSNDAYCYYYAHLDRYAPGLREGMKVEQGDIIGYVGSTGNAPKRSPHLHFTIFELGPDKKWWLGKAINPFQPLVSAAAKASMGTN